MRKSDPLSNCLDSITPLHHVTSLISDWSAERSLHHFSSLLVEAEVMEDKHIAKAASGVVY